MVDGGWVKWGQFFCLGEMLGLMVFDIEQLVVFDVFVVCDLCELWECEEVFFFWFVEGGLEVFMGVDFELMVWDVLFQFEIGEQVWQMMVEGYLCIVEDKVGVYKLMFEWFVVGEQLFVVYCFVGKDCVGVVLSFVLYVFGVFWDVVMVDYELMNCYSGRL